MSLLSKTKTNLGLLFLRLSVGVTMLFAHGWPKLIKLINGDFSFADPIGLGAEFSLIAAVFTEFICSALIIIGFKTRIASAFLFITMIVAAVIVHGADPFAKKELALIYAASYLCLFCSGAGSYSADRT